MLTRQDRNPLSAKDELGTPRLQGGRILTAILSQLFSIFYLEMPDYVCTAHLSDFL
jgi:hypothetical protein